MKRNILNIRKRQLNRKLKRIIKAFVKYSFNILDIKENCALKSAEMHSEELNLAKKMMK